MKDGQNFPIYLRTFPAMCIKVKIFRYVRHCPGSRVGQIKLSKLRGQTKRSQKPPDEGLETDGLVPNCLLRKDLQIPTTSSFPWRCCIARHGHSNPVPESPNEGGEPRRLWMTGGYISRAARNISQRAASTHPSLFLRPFKHQSRQNIECSNWNRKQG